MQKITLLLEYPDDARPEFSANMTLHGGKVETVQFNDLFATHDALEAEAVALVDMDPSHALFGFRIQRLRAVLSESGAEVDEEITDEQDADLGSTPLGI
jgi:TorA maturation chaperone TorD